MEQTPNDSCSSSPQRDYFIVNKLQTFTGNEKRNIKYKYRRHKPTNSRINMDESKTIGTYAQVEFMGSKCHVQTGLQQMRVQ
jgi:hypothetical protein